MNPSLAPPMCSRRAGMEPPPTQLPKAFERQEPRLHRPGKRQAKSVKTLPEAPKGCRRMVPLTVSWAFGQLFLPVLGI